ncbi:MAG: hypothetical protein Q9181_003214 [Wetmoreana brouardii]
MFALAAVSCIALLLPEAVLTASIHARTSRLQAAQHALFSRNAASTLTIATVTCPQTWHDWPGVEKIFSFGDSYTDTGFNPTGAQPDDNHPLGNPFSNSSTPPYHTSTNGPNWIEYLTFKYNESQINTYNLAISGSTVNDTALGSNSTADLVHQISDRFVPNYVRKNTIGWTSSNSLFTLFFGINDVNRSWNKRDLKINDEVFSSYLRLLDQLYQHGARNFLLHTIPPIDRGPYMNDQDQPIEGKDINDFNYRMQILFNSFTSAHNDVSVLLFNTNKLFSEAIDNPSTWPQTAIYKNTTGSCKAYETGDVPSMDYYNETCQYPVNQYLWLNGLHPTYPIHEAMAAQVAIALKQ